MQFNASNHAHHDRKLSRNQLAASPFDQFRIWYEESISAGIIEPNAMALATAASDGKPSCRMVLMKNFDTAGVVFFTNYGSRKALEIESQKYASVCFFWRELERQVIVEGSVEKTSFQESKAYFDGRSRGRRIGALASRQDSVIASRKILEDEYEKLNKKYHDNDDIPLSNTWGGFRIKPCRFEFWQGREDRLHDRFQYKLGEDSVWKIERLSP